MARKDRLARTAFVHKSSPAADEFREATHLGNALMQTVTRAGRARMRVECACTASTSACTCSGGVCWLMPWPRLKMWPARCPDRMRRAEALQHAARASASICSRLREQHVRIEVALQRLALADAARARRAEVHGPVQPDDIAVRAAPHLLQPQAAALGEHDARHARAVVLALQLAQHARACSARLNSWNAPSASTPPQLSKIITACAPASICALR